MSKHSKGPWTQHGHFIFSGSESIALIKAASDERGSKQRQKANGDLIVCAPELLDMLIRVVNTLADPSRTINSHELYQLIAKARGQSS